MTGAKASVRTTKALRIVLPLCGVPPTWWGPCADGLKRTIMGSSPSRCTRTYPGMFLGTQAVLDAAKRSPSSAGEPSTLHGARHRPPLGVSWSGAGCEELPGSWHALQVVFASVYEFDT